MEKTDVAGLIQRCREGDAQAQEALVLAVQNRVYYHCKKMLRHEENALDATQEVLISMLRKLDTLKEPAAFWGWLSAMTANQCRNALARGPREVQFPVDEEGNSLLDTYETLDQQAVPDQAMDSKESRRMIVELVDALPQAQRQCVLMYYYEEMGVKEIAAALETSEGTVKSRLNYARKAIKAGVERYAAQGVKLYGLAPLPFLSYILKQDALVGGLTAAQSGACVQAALAGSSSALAAGASGTAGGTAAEGAAAAGAAGTGTSSAGPLLGAVLAHKGVAAAVAGLVLAGAIGGAALLARPEPEAEQSAPPPAVEVIEPAEDPQPAEESGPAEDPQPVETPEPESQPVQQPQTEPLPGPEQEPAPEPEPVPQRDPVPQPQPEPEPAPTAPSQLKLAYDSISGGYGTVRAAPISVYSGKTPFESIVYSSTNPSVAYVGERNVIYLLRPGQAEITITFPQDGNYQVRIPVTVENHFQWDYAPPSSPVTLSVGQTTVESVSPYAIYSGTTLDSVTWTSSNPSVVQVEGVTKEPSTLISAVAPGTATITATVHFTITGIGYQTTDTFSFDVVVNS